MAGLFKGLTISLKMNIVPSAGATLSVNGLDPKPIKFRDNQNINNFIKGAVYDFIYDGTSFNVKQAIPTGTITQGGFEVVDALPTTNLFIGRQVTYNNSTYRYNGVAWRKVAAIADRVYPYQCNVNLYSDATAGAIIIRTPISSNGDNNNSMTYLEVSVYTHVVGEAVAKYLIYCYEYPSNTSYNKLSYSIIGSPAFEKVRIGYYNNHQCIVLGNFDKTYRYHVVLNVVATGFKRTTDDTDKFEIIKDADESNYTGLFEGYGVQFAYARGFKVPNGTATQMLMADGSTKETSDFLTSTDLPKHTIDGECMIIG